MRWIVLLVFLSLTALAALALRFLPWWGIVLLVIAVLVAARFAAGRIVLMLFTIPFRMKGKVLRRAEVEVHSIESIPAPAPARAEGSDVDMEEGSEDRMVEEKGPREFYAVDVTIRPRPSIGGFQFWEPGEILLIPWNARATLDDDGDGAETIEADVFDGGRFDSDGVGKYPGPQRLRMVFGVPAGATRRRRFRYYFERFGDLRLPGPNLDSATTPPRSTDVARGS